MVTMGDVPPSAELTVMRTELLAPPLPLRAAFCWASNFFLKSSFSALWFSDGGGVDCLARGLAAAFVGAAAGAGAGSDACGSSFLVGLRATLTGCGPGCAAGAPLAGAGAPLAAAGGLDDGAGDGAGSLGGAVDFGAGAGVAAGAGAGAVSLGAGGPLVDLRATRVGAGAGAGSLGGSFGAGLPGFLLASLFFSSASASCPPSPGMATPPLSLGDGAASVLAGSDRVWSEGSGSGSGDSGGSCMGFAGGSSSTKLEGKSPIFPASSPFHQPLGSSLIT
mmetsp:Transcript_8351/g.11511  ORF Transcript_8351/g.11511 Transcript_8351/m.11511 type:complete len:278 (-) Transcript_8351:620-1453(-)